LALRKNMNYLAKLKLNEAKARQKMMAKNEEMLTA
jgi:hypothetical protein